MALSLARREPRVESVELTDGRSIAVVNGEHFGVDGRLEIDGLAVLREDVQSWTSDRIVFRIAPGRSSGLLRVQTDVGVSNPVFLAVPADLPVVAAEDILRVASFTPTEIAAGTILRVRGFGFGPRSVFSQITFRFLSSGQQLEVNGVSSWVVHWSNTEIRVVIPPGIETGPIEILINGETLGEQTTGTPIDLQEIIGAPKTHAVVQQLTVSGSGLSDSAVETRVVIPQIPVTTAQDSVQLLRQQGDLLGALGSVAWVYQAAPIAPDEAVETDSTGFTIQRTDYVERRSMEVVIPEELPPVNLNVLQEEDFRTAFAGVLGAVDGMRPDDPVIGRIGAEELSGFRHPLAIARRIHNLVVTTLEPDPNQERSLKQAVIDGRGDARDYADLAVLIARRLGIPARRQIGVLLDQEDRSRDHAWVEFFIPGYGWLPSDPAMSDGIYLVSSRSEDEAAVEESPEDLAELPPFGAIDDRRVTMYVDGREAPRVEPGTIILVPSRQYAPGLQRVELSEEPGPEEIVVEWSFPELVLD